MKAKAEEIFDGMWITEYDDGTRTLTLKRSFSKERPEGGAFKPLKVDRFAIGYGEKETQSVGKNRGASGDVAGSSPAMWLAVVTIEKPLGQGGYS
jgi:hypothetical protein